MPPTPNIPHHIAKFVLEQSSYDALPANVVTIAKEMMVNAAAVGLAGAAQQDGHTVTRFVQDMGGNGKCTIIGKGLRTSPVYAALANGAMIHLLDFDDEVIPNRSHPSSVIFPVVMALGEMNGIAGPEVLAAFVLGCELTSKLGAALAENGRLAGAIGAAAAAGRLLGLNSEQLAQAVGLACVGSQISVHPEPVEERGGSTGSPRADNPMVSSPRTDNFGQSADGLAGPARAYGQGRAAMNGVMAAMLVKQGLGNPVGLSSIFSHGNAGDLADFWASLGNPYDIVSPGVSLKLYPCASQAHTAIDAALQLAQQYRVAPEQLAAVKVGVTAAALESLPFSTPANGWEARFCLSYIVAVALAYGQPLIDNFTDAAVQDSRVRQLMDLVTVAATETASRSIPNPCSVAITLNDGRQIRHRVEFARGQPELPLSPEELDAKFLYCSRYILPPDHIEEAVTRLRDLENIENTTGLFSVLGG